MFKYSRMGFICRKQNRMSSADLNRRNSHFWGAVRGENVKLN